MTIKKLNEKIIKEDALKQLDEIFKDIPSVPQERKELWIDGVFKNLFLKYSLEEENKFNLIQTDLKWHIDRLKGFGGSDMAVFMQEYIGENRHPFSNSEKIMREKLLLDIPQPPNKSMEEGIALEYNARRAFKNSIILQRIDYKVDIQAQEKIKQLCNKKDRINSWLVGNPDDILILNNKCVIVDYKVSTESTEHTYQLQDYYKFQLLHYKLLAKEAGIDVNNLFIVSYIKNDKNQLYAKPYYIDFDKEDYKKYNSYIYDIGKKMWEYRNQGQVQKLIPEKPIEIYSVSNNLSQCFPNEYKNILQDAIIYGSLNELSKFIDNISKPKKENIQNILQNSLSINELSKENYLKAFKEGQLKLPIKDLPGISISSEITLDINKLELSEDKEIKNILENPDNYDQVIPSKNLQETVNIQNNILKEIKEYINSNKNSKQMINPDDMEIFVKRKENELDKKMNFFKIKNELNLDKVKNQLLELDKFKQNPNLIMNYVKITNFRFLSNKKEFEEILKNNGFKDLNQISQETLTKFLTDTGIINYLKEFLNKINSQNTLINSIEPLDNIIENSNLLNNLNKNNNVEPTSNNNKGRKGKPPGGSGPK